MDWTDNYKTATAQGKQPPASPIWKPIGEAAQDLVMSIEQIDGYRVPVCRHFGMDHASELLDMENQNRLQRDIIREAFRMAEPFSTSPSRFELPLNLLLGSPT